MVISLSYDLTVSLYYRKLFVSKSIEKVTTRYYHM